MILTPHILLGAAIASKIPNIWGLILAFLSHFVLDAIPHYEYSIKGIQRLKKNRFLRDVLKVELDFCLGVMIFTFVAVGLSPIRAVYGLLGIAAAVLPDGLMFFYYISGKRWFKNLGEFHYFIHRKGRGDKRKPDRHSLQFTAKLFTASCSCTISLRAAPFVKGAGSSLSFNPFWSSLFGPKGKGLSEFQFEIPRRQKMSFYRVFTQVLAAIVAILILRL